MKNKKKLALIISPIVVILGIMAVLFFGKTDYYLEMPGDVYTVSSMIKGKKIPNNLGMVTVEMTSEPATYGQYLLSYFNQFTDRVSAKEMLEGQTSEQYEELQNWYMQTSEQTALYVAAKYSKKPTKLNYNGVYVMSVQKSSTFYGKLHLADTIVAVNGHHFKSTEEMTTYLGKLPLGQKVVLDILRNGKEKKLSGKIVKIESTKRHGIGISMVERLSVETKPKLKIAAGDIGGPSAGLMFTLGAYQAFTGKNLTNGQFIAGTGTIEKDGTVGMIGGVDKKVVAASRVGAKIFFAPTDHRGIKASESNYAVAKATAKKIGTKMKIVPVANFKDALTYLQKHFK
ncbi:MAG: SepM family pheromone-processing serine protease [Lactobacillus sp.]|nr:SepM family pheromone-processing serine protease [Lactobacillus sp.]